MIFDIHIFVCTNQRTGSQKLSCGEVHGLELVGEFKKQLKDLNVNIKTRANKSGCLGICDFGPTIVIYPEGTFYVGVQKEDVKEIIQSHIINKIPVKRLLLKSDDRVI
ncbi:MAG: ferrodoxin [Bacteroidetes bacterium]|nr:ferrodoxin [Bacteroidota bacterium]